jgi:hypothetical protein
MGGARIFVAVTNETGELCALASSDAAIDFFDLPVFHAKRMGNG